MRQPFFLRLGAGKTRRYPLAQQAIWLDRAAQAGLPTPPGIILLDEGWQRLLADDIIRLEGADVHVDGADILLHSFALHALPRPVAVRPLLAGGAAAPLASRLDVPPDEPRALIHAVIDVWQTGHLRPNVTRRDVLIMDMVAAQECGLALLHSGQAEDGVQRTDKPGGQALEPAQPLPRLTAWQRPSAPTPTLRRLQQLLRGVRRSLGAEIAYARLAWVDDGRSCWLWGIEPGAARP